jgi:hypothetical protein
MIKKKNKNKGSKWFSPGKPLNWSKKDSQTLRRREALKARKGNYLKAARALQALANVQKNNDPETARKAEGDAKYFLKLYHVKKDKSEKR